MGDRSGHPFRGNQYGRRGRQFLLKAQTVEHATQPSRHYTTSISVSSPQEGGGTYTISRGIGKSELSIEHSKEGSVDSSHVGQAKTAREALGVALVHATRTNIKPVVGGRGSYDKVTAKRTVVGGRGTYGDVQARTKADKIFASYAAAGHATPHDFFQKKMSLKKLKSKSK